MKSIIIKIGRGFVSVGTGVLRFFDSVEKVDAIYHAMTPEAKAAMVKTLQDVLAFVAACEAAGLARGSNFALDAAVLATAQQLYRDAVLDIDSAKKVFAALGVSIPAPALPQAA